MFQHWSTNRPERLRLRVGTGPFCSPGVGFAIGARGTTFDRSFAFGAKQP
jgi:hypothetical protein